MDPQLYHQESSDIASTLCSITNAQSEARFQSPIIFALNTVCCCGTQQFFLVSERRRTHRTSHSSQRDLSAAAYRASNHIDAESIPILNRD